MRDNPSARSGAVDSAAGARVVFSLLIYMPGLRSMSLETKKLSCLEQIVGNIS